VIFATVGNATQGFGRLIHAVDAWVAKGLAEGRPVFIQTGHSRDVVPQYCDWRAFLPMDEFEWRLRSARLVICHGGCGTVLQAVRLGKLPVVMPRRKKYEEHVNDHQIQLVEALASEGYVVPAYEAEDLPEAIAAAATHRHDRSPGRSPAPMMRLVRDAIETIVGAQAICGDRVSPQVTERE
jgi:UDP-N-acetylglucosamine transferase subunit ALG13